MKRAVILSLILSIAASGLLTLQANAGGKKNKKKIERVQREVQEPYLGPTLTFGSPPRVSGMCARNPVADEPGLGCVYFDIDPKVDRFASVTIDDRSAGDVHAYVLDEYLDVLADVCTQTEDTFALGRATEIAVWISAQPCSHGAPSTPTTGIVKVTFSNLP